MPKRIVVTGASGGLGALIAGELAGAGHVVYADVEDTGPGGTARTAGGGPAGALCPVPLDGSDQQTVTAVVDGIRQDEGTVDIAVHCTGPAAVGPAESFTPFQLFGLYDGNVLSAQRVNRALLPHMREEGAGLLVWVGLGAGEEPSPCLAPYAAVRAAALELARSYAVELSPFGIESSFVFTGPLLPDPGDFDELVVGHDKAAADEYAEVLEHAGDAFAELASHHPDARGVARAVLAVVDAPVGSRPPHVTVEPDGKGAPALRLLLDRLGAAVSRPAGADGPRKEPGSSGYPAVPRQFSSPEGPPGAAAGPATRP